ncbi:hypothetical protein [Gordonia oryzae]|uniref:hypothetical protein n=1 Tax=Gordonia oryzae TaxID=2487349 RepID=UPI003F845BFD
MDKILVAWPADVTLGAEELGGSASGAFEKQYAGVSPTVPTIEVLLDKVLLHLRA